MNGATAGNSARPPDQIPRENGVGGTDIQQVDGRVSVVLPTYERGQVIGTAIESVLGQTYEDLELQVVDGGSTDGTPDVVTGFSRGNRSNPHTRSNRRDTARD